MSKNVAVFVDVANLYYSARGQDVDVDYVALLKAATKGRDLIRAYAYSGLDPENENQRKFIDFLGKNGYKVLTKDIRKFGDGRVKANLDIELVVDLFRLAERMDIAVVVSGDGDFAPAIKALQDKGIRCEVISFRPNTSSDLIAVADEFIDVMKIAGIGRGSKEAKAQRGMSAPEMPAKEVVPEFGFREASPSVAQAALAAIREGRPARAGNGAGERAPARSRARGGAAPDEEVVEANGAAAADADGDARRRRRRRGGRGRGRGRRGEEQAVEVGQPAGEIGWTELDDLSQLDEAEAFGDLGEEREYSFEEADEATLAELGLLDDHAGEAPVSPAVEVAEQAEEAATGSPEAGAEGVAQAAAPDEAAPGEAIPGEAPPKRRRRARPTAGQEATAAEPDPAEAGEAASARPRRPRTTSGKAKAAAEGETVSPGEGAAEEAARSKPAARRRAASAGRATRSRAAAGGAAEAPSPEAGLGESKPSKRPTRRRTRPGEPAEQPSEGPGAEAGGGDEGQGIWQRFRSARGSRPS